MWLLPTRRRGSLHRGRDSLQVRLLPSRSSGSGHRWGRPLWRLLLKESLASLLTLLPLLLRSMLLLVVLLLGLELNSISGGELDGPAAGGRQA